ncbi:DUF6527 family protein [Larkinella humicola]|uniref:Uncharacterized protein n=1 Tax=Larkinella humicola TaxID=2607654 RepID=A0A5N1JBJ2_9BACT|nr:DUF6527 family protein [Larkinella humicola]KAA9349728.1 hypothetical protein F0P93_19955 [Larkinella humicola]
MKIKSLQHSFVKFIPKTLDEGVLYVSIEYCTAAHNCVCGCGNRVVTPISPTDWRLLFDGETVSLSPSIGNWGFECQSHYWIKQSKIEWAGKWKKEQINAGRNKDFQDKKEYFKQKDAEILGQEIESKVESTIKSNQKKGFWERLLNKLGL